MDYYSLKKTMMIFVTDNKTGVCSHMLPTTLITEGHDRLHGDMVGGEVSGG